MKLSYKKRLLNQVLLASTVLLAASLAQGTVFANTEEIPPTTSETVTPLPEETPIMETNTSEATDNLVEGKETEKQTEEIADTSPTPVSTEEYTTSSEPNAEETTLRTANNDNQNTTEEKTAVPTIDTITLETKTVYLSEAATITESVTLPDTTEKIEWTLDGKPISEWKTWNLKEGDFTGDTFITVEESRQDNQLHLNIQLAALFGEDLSKRTPSNIRRTYRHFIKDMLLEGTSADGNLIISKTLHFRPYEAYRTHEEMLTEIEETKNNAATDRLVRIESNGQSAEGRDIKMAVVAKDQASIDKYLTETTPLMLTQPDQMLKQLQAGTFDYRLPILINNTHADEQPGIDVVTSLFKEFAQKDTITFPSTDADGNPVTLHLKVTDLLDKFIFLFNFTENPDGDVKNLRSLVNGLDPNRDTGFQVNPETQAIVRQIHKWNPISVLDIHGFVSGFLIEPATPPHDPNFEYDLLADIMLEKAHEMGRAGIANSKYERYTIPKVHWGDGWDDSFSGYTAVYAMYHGILGHTIEIPEGNQESFKAGFFAVLGGVHNMATKPDSLMEMRLKYYSRGVNKIEDPKAEAELVGPDGAVVGRVKKDQPKFFPDYYVVPMTLDKNNDMQETFKMIEYFNRNGVVVKELTEDVGNFRKGDLVVDMAQAKRGFANHVLYAGSDESAWGAMYAELVVNFPDMKGFSAKAVFEENAFSGKLGSITWTKAPRTTEIDFKAPYYVVANTSESAVQAINQAIKSGAKVYLTDDGYIMETNQFSHLLDTYALYGEPLYKKPLGQELKAMKVYAPSHSYSWAGDFAILANAALAVERMGFEVVNRADEADAIILESDQFDASVFGKKPIIIVGGVAMQKLEELGILAGFNAEQFTDGGDYEGLMRAIIDDKDPLTSGYAVNGLFYSNSGNWIEGIPEGFKTLIKIADKDYYIAGWWPGHDKLANKIVAIAGNYQDQPVFIYAGNPTNKVHPVHFFRWVSNALFGSQLATLEDLPAVEILVPQPEIPKNILDEAPKTTTVVHNTKSTKAKQLPQTGEKTNYIAIALGRLLLGSIALRRKERS
ncbi:TPA: LPXTG cell wall anchor domain-containing protein [Streptococcus suis]|nr:LPXTG cell wall anchor domain-containing protein [Streptococcus suis]HEP1824526.1 LPXTG cell wall anchor domain-containing protein [Streptococcus suis]HEP1829244.1 LPXTG cell wall anchor domain-containing protein [Streptococcus suis]